MIELDKVAVNFGDRKLFSDVSLTLPQGSFHFLIGPSGAGKTTLLRLCSMEMQPTEGEVSLLGQTVSGLQQSAVAAMRQRIGVVHQDSRFIDHLTVSENVVLPASVSGQSGPNIDFQLVELLGWVGLAAQAEQYPLELSGGERQRAALARAVILSPDVILADEPTGNVDWDMSVHILDLLIELNKLGKTILCATHDLNLVRHAKSRVSAKVLRLKRGVIEVAGAAL
ncbi:ATP-binding cassette domain-containing protein [Rhodobacteraceae bacterium]|nr:ATP-binding cassette domain-containing protein [Paracoccaceae bacterium]